MEPRNLDSLSNELLRLDYFLFENYKAFPGVEYIKLRPLTILIGKNNSGKSVIARLPIQIARAFSLRAEAPLEVQFDGYDFGGSFLDLIHKKNPHGKVKIETGFSSIKDHVQISAEMQHFDDIKLHLISQLTIKIRDKFEMSLRWDGDDPLHDKIYSINDTSKKCIIPSFQGFLPKHVYKTGNKKHETDLDHINSVFEIISKNLANTVDRMTYLGPFREQPKRSYPFPMGRVRHVAVAGRQAPALLADDVLRDKGKVLEAVSQWFNKHLGQFRLGLALQENTFSLVLVDPSNPDLKINIVDVGTGIAQVLPIVVQRQFESLHHQPDGLEIVEEPELHLHPSAHGDLADLYVKAVKHTDMRFILETHSENFILRLRRRVAEGKLDPDNVIIYWVQDPGATGPRIQPITIHEDGEVDTWPDGVFSEDFDEVSAIRTAQRRRKS